ncbi:MAG TPA: response regulator [Ferruginibacter sp.]|jgi:DNA-binding response OmpR family regulator|nr:response regulator [Ferruginibacter sp.]
MANILVLDDSKDLLQMIKAIFQLHNYEVRTALTKSSLLAHMEIFKPDIILMDVLLEGSNGKEICKELKTDPATKNIPVILLSGSHEQLRNYKEYSADDIIEKPFEFEDVERKVKLALRKKQAVKVFS